MLFLYTGQPGHGKTVFALEHLLRFKEQGRDVYATNVRKLDYGKAGITQFSPDEVRDWPNQLPDGAVLLVDECYEHEMFPKRRPGSAVPEHVKQLAKHRHRGLDFIIVCQSPAKQVDEFVHDLVEEHYHVRRRFGLPFAHIRRFDRYERNPEKTTPLAIKRRKYPKHIFGLYESTKFDTSEKRVPWFYWAAAALLAFVVLGGWWTLDTVFSRFEPGQQAAKAAPAKNGASATVVAGGAEKPMTKEEWLDRLTPRHPGIHGSQPVFDDRPILAKPRTFCVMSGGPHGGERCTCYTEQVTRIPNVSDDVCRFVAVYGQYDPFLAPPAVGHQYQGENHPDESGQANLAGSAQEPGEVGNPAQGEVWGKKPDTLRATWTPGF